MSLAVYGNFIIDELITINQPLQAGGSHNCTITSRMGGIANFCRACTDIEVTAITAIGGDNVRECMVYYRTENLRHITIIKPTEQTSKAVVIADKATNSRTGFVQWGACSKYSNWSPVQADWHHIMYLDRMNITPDQLAQFKNVSVDFCNVNDIEKYTKYFPYINLFIISQLDGLKHLSDVRSLRNANIIIHSPMYIYHMSDDNVLQSCDIETVNGLNVVGAGDYLAARCLINMLNTGNPNLHLSHLQTLQMLKDQS